MEERSIEKLRAEFVSLLRQQIDALEVETYVGLTDAEQSEYDRRQERIRDLEAKISELLDSPPLSIPPASKQHHYR